MCHWWTSKPWHRWTFEICPLMNFKTQHFMQIDSVSANTTWEKIAKAFWIPDNK
jgi:hypothetical protein